MRSGQVLRTSRGLGFSSAVVDGVERALIQIISRRIILTNHQNTSSLALDSSTTKFKRISPNDLRVMAAHLAGGAGVMSRIVKLLLFRPRFYRFLRRPVIQCSPKQILTVRTVGMDHSAIVHAFHSPTTGVSSQFLVPI